MMCACGGHGVVLETRGGNIGFGADKKRRYRCPSCGKRWSTVEARVPEGGGEAAAGGAWPEMIAALRDVQQAGQEISGILRTADSIKVAMEALESAEMRLADLAIEIENAWLARGVQ